MSFRYAKFRYNAVFLTHLSEVGDIYHNSWRLTMVVDKKTKIFFPGFTHCLMFDFSIWEKCVDNIKLV